MLKGEARVKWKETNGDGFTGVTTERFESNETFYQRVFQVWPKGRSGGAVRSVKGELISQGLLVLVIAEILIRILI